MIFRKVEVVKMLDDGYRVVKAKSGNGYNVQKYCFFWWSYERAILPVLIYGDILLFDSIKEAEDFVTDIIETGGYD